MSQYESFLLHTLVFLDSRTLRSWKDVRTALQPPAHERKILTSWAATRASVNALLRPPLGIDRLLDLLPPSRSPLLLPAPRKGSKAYRVVTLTDTATHAACGTSYPSSSPWRQQSVGPGVHVGKYRTSSLSLRALEVNTISSCHTCTWITQISYGRSIRWWTNCDSSSATRCSVLSILAVLPTPQCKFSLSHWRI